MYSLYKYKHFKEEEKIPPALSFLIYQMAFRNHISTIYIPLFILQALTRDQSARQWWVRAKDLEETVAKTVFAYGQSQSIS